MFIQLSTIPGAKLYFYDAGTTTPLAVYTDAGLSTAHTQPVVADSEGFVPDIYLQAKNYKCVVKDADDATIYTMEPIYKERILTIVPANPSTTHPGMTVWNTTDGKQYVRSADNLSWYDQGPFTGAGNVATVSQQLTGSDNSAYSTSSSVAALWKKGTDITLTSTACSLPSTGGGFFNVGGSFDIASINSATDGREVWLYHTVARNLTYSSNFTTLSGVNTPIRAGDMTCHIRDGTAWRMVAHVSPNDSGLGAKTGNYTGLVTENGKFFPYTVSSAATHTLPAAASAFVGFRTTIANRHASTANVTIDGNGAETIDGLATRLLYPGDCVTLICDGSNWITQSGNGYKFTSAEQTITAAGALTIAHGLARMPRRVTARLVCKTNEANYTANQTIVVGIGTLSSATDNGYGLSVITDATNLTVRFGSNATTFAVPDATSGSLAALTNTNWRLILEAEE